MIEINLIPDVKREYLHAQRMRNGVISLSTLVRLVVLKMPTRLSPSKTN